MINKTINQEQLEALCSVLGHTDNGFSKSELSGILRRSDIKTVDDGSLNNGYSYKD